RSERNSRLCSTVQSRDRFLSLRLSLSGRVVSRAETEPHSLCSTRCAARKSPSKQSQRSRPRPESRKLWLRNGRRSLLVTLNLVWSSALGGRLSGEPPEGGTPNSLILRHYFLTTLEQFAHFAFRGRRQNL